MHKYFIMISFKNWLQKEEENPPAGDLSDVRNPVVAQTTMNKAVSQATSNPVNAKLVNNVANSNNNKETAASSMAAASKIMNKPTIANNLTKQGVTVADVAAQIAKNITGLDQSIKGMKKK